MFRSNSARVPLMFRSCSAQVPLGFRSCSAPHLFCAVREGGGHSAERAERRREERHAPERLRAVGSVYMRSACAQTRLPCEPTPAPDFGRLLRKFRPVPGATLFLGQSLRIIRHAFLLSGMLPHGACLCGRTGSSQLLA